MELKGWGTENSQKVQCEGKKIRKQEIDPERKENWNLKQWRRARNHEHLFWSALSNWGKWHMGLSQGLTKVSIDRSVWWTLKHAAYKCMVKGTTHSHKDSEFHGVSSRSGYVTFSLYGENEDWSFIVLWRLADTICWSKAIFVLGPCKQDLLRCLII